MRLLLLLPLLLLASCEYSYRYPCQDPANWNKLECNNEVCRADGTCTEDTLGKKFMRDPQVTPGATPIEETSNEPAITEDVETNEHSCKPVVKYIKEESETGNAGLERSTEETVEQPVTMNTMVDTTDHDSATR